MTSLFDVSTSFVTALVNREFHRAHTLLAPELKRTMTSKTLESQFNGIFRGYAEGEPTEIWYDENCATTEWPGKLSDDLGIIYVAIRGVDFNEAVSITVTNIDGQPLIREIIWGRP